MLDSAPRIEAAGRLPIFEGRGDTDRGRVSQPCENEGNARKRLFNLRHDGASRLNGGLTTPSPFVHFDGTALRRNFRTEKESRAAAG